MDNELYHHGIKGQKWGVRRYQNKDGTLTPAGKQRVTAIRRVKSAAKTKSAVEDIISTLSEKEKKFLALDDDDKYLTIEQGEHVVKRFLNKVGTTPISFFDMMDDGGTINVALGTRSGEQYRGKGYASTLAKKGRDWFDKNSNKYDAMVWGVDKNNYPSIAIAKKLGFEYEPGSEGDDGFVNYIYKSKKKKKIK